jgi:hypothetical protein
MFICILSSGIVTDSWLLGNIKPIYKSKGDPLNPKHFRPITILSCFDKLFTSILYILPFLLLINNLDHTASRHTVSKAFSKSTSAAKSFFFFNENLKPFLFSLYLNDLEKILDENNAIGLISLTEDLEQELDTYLKLFYFTVC